MYVLALSDYKQFVIKTILPTIRYRSILLYACGRIKRKKYLKMKLLRRKVDEYLLTCKSQSY